MSPKLNRRRGSYQTRWNDRKISRMPYCSATGRPCGHAIGYSVAASVRSIHSIFALIERRIDLDRGPAGDGCRDSAPQIRNRNAAQFVSAISRISKITRSRSPCPTAAGAAFTAMVRLPNGSVSNPDAVQFIGDARVFDLLLRRELQNHRHQQVLYFHASGGLLASTCSNRMRSCATC